MVEDKDDEELCRVLVTGFLWIECKGWIICESKMQLEEYVVVTFMANGAQILRPFVAS